MAGRLLVKQKNLRHLGRRPPFGQSKHRLDTVGLTFITQVAMEFFQLSYFFSGQPIISHIPYLSDKHALSIEKAENFNPEQYNYERSE